MKNEMIIQNNIESKILSLRGKQVMIDRDLAELYGVETKRLNEQVKRNIERFPAEFCFQLTATEKAELVANCDHFNPLKHSTTEPYAFTEHGVTMLAAVLKSEIVLIDGYVDLSVLERLAKKKNGVNVTIYTDPKTKLTSQDVQKFNAQYPTMTVKHTTKMHDRFLIIDNAVLYHVGASLKDLGKKCFAFEILDSSLISAIFQNL
ncbi:MAG: ORF6N domain-containing protein [Treponema sp.]